VDTFRLSPDALAAGYRLEAHERIGSTNARALELAANGETGPLWVVTDDQFSGRGRRGRQWHGPKGNLAASLLITPRTDLGTAATLGFAASIALSDALGRLAPEMGLSLGLDGMDANGPGRTRLELKWPNDVLLSGAKIAGILLESASLRGGAPAVVIGIGVNVVAAPDDVGYPATSLRAVGFEGSAADVLAVLADAWLDAHRVWSGGDGLPQVRRRWLERAAGLDAPVAVRTGGGIVRGRLETIDDDCRLIVRHDDGTVTKVAAGDVHFGAVATERQAGQHGGEN